MSDISALDLQLRALMSSALGISEDRVHAFTAETLLFGALPELDSMAVASLLTELEDHFGIMVDDEDLDGTLFENYGNLLSYLIVKKQNK
ncbi:acyl carrier protein [Aquisediminimonas sediminicola]|uniref:acyl carrier protein n=1 Tax=Alteraquisediminimonas sediminicola TaxID=2676787 RepID=UPI001C8E09FC|nr:acyl carrier protein [Aquisediminimonas sediminicola]